MIPIASTEDTRPWAELHIRQTFTMTQHESNGEIINILRRKTAQALAEKIIENERFFNLEINGAYGELRTDIIVMTVDEYFDFAKRKHKEGFDRAQGYMPTQWGAT